MKEEHKLTKGHLLTTIPQLEKEWRVSFDFLANSYKGIGQILHMTIGGKGYGSGAKYGDRTPAIWTHSTRGLLVASGVRGKVSYAKFFKPLPSIGAWVNIEIKQEVEASQMIYSVTIGGKKVLSTLNSKPSKFENVQVLSSSSWYTPTDGYIKHLVIENKNSGKGQATPPKRINFRTPPPSIWENYVAICYQIHAQ